ncbi:hypothetical protein [Stenotrophomonas sp. 364]|uniref:hypothetical protein n=1 Tax=Stenotrophomonas sp. 364 TaxID=2691571 RepID=UPI00131759D0|nr:hypothetical protein [Stenotrophomonas sp. 364]QHB72932.1 hypothetical protein GQ674_17265 [Stenotrophomonas sp. 364]
MNFARFATFPIGRGLEATDGGLSLASTAPTTLDQFARSDVGCAAGAAGAEFYFWGDSLESGTYGAAVGLVPAEATVDVGMAAVGLEWRVASGELYRGPTLLRADLPTLGKGDIAGIRVVVDGDDAPVRVQLFRNAVQIHAGTVQLEGVLHFAVSLISPAAGRLRCVVNAGQWQGASEAINGGGWKQPSTTLAPLRLSVEPYMSASTDTPPNAAYLDLVAGDGLDAVASIAFWPWEGISRAGSASLKLQDGDGVLDAVALSDVRDVPVQVRRVDQGRALSTATAVSRYVLERIDIEDDGRKTAVLRDPHDDLDAPLHRAVFLPSINDQIAWQPQPVIIGAVRSAPTVPVNRDGSVQWVADAPLSSVAKVLDRGAEITAGDGYVLVSGGQQLAFGAPPVGPVIADVSSVGPDMRPATLERALQEVFRRIDKSAWSSQDARAIDSASGYAGIGFHAGAGSTPRQALAAMLPSYGADWWQDGEGILRITRMIDPDEVAETDLSFDLDWRELAGDLVVRPDLAPNLTRRMAYQPNAVLLSSGDMVSDLGLLTPTQRQQLSGPFRGQVYAGGPLASRYVRAEAAAPMVSRFDRREDAQAEIDRVIALYAVPRNFYDGRLAARTDIGFRPGQVGRITYPRYGLQAGRRVLVTSALSNPVSGRHVVRFWGA